MSDQDHLIEFVGSFRDRPLDYVMAAYPWSEPDSELERFSGPEDWQRDCLQEMQDACLRGQTWQRPYREAMCSGHDTGKSALLAWVEDWARSTFVGTRIRVTSVTEPQLRTTLWVEMAKWFNLSISRTLFKWSATSIRSADPELEETWRTDAMAWSKENPAAFAGIHNYGKRLVYIFDEAAGIPDIIWTVVDGVMKEKDTELFMFAASQGLYNSGRFYECFNSMKALWHTHIIDSREVRMANIEEIDAEIAARGGPEDDIVRVRIRGLFPLASQSQFFPTPLITQARTLPVSEQPWEPLVLGVDVARRGGDSCVAQFRQGKDARSIPPISWVPSPLAHPTVETAEIIGGLINQYRPRATFVDQTGYGAGVVDVLRKLGHTIYGVEFGSQRVIAPNGINVLNKRAEMYVSFREWLLGGGRIPDMQILETEMLSILYTYVEGKAGVIKLRSKEDMKSLGLVSPDHTDALALTFALPVSIQWAGPVKGVDSAQPEYNAFDVEPNESGVWERKTVPVITSGFRGVFDDWMRRPN